VTIVSGTKGSETGTVAPFSEREYVNVPRAASILGVSFGTIYRLAESRDCGGWPPLTLVSYRRGARKRVLYSSIVHFCDILRQRHCIADRRPALDHPMFRHRDEDLLPFPLSDTIYSAEALAALGYEDRRPLTRLTEEGKFEAYQLWRESKWRISRRSFELFLAKVKSTSGSKTGRDRPL